jgi:hypothetical protein
MSKAAKPANVSVVIRPDAHVDEAYLNAGYVSKVEPLVVESKAGRELLAAFGFLMITED